MFSFSPVNRPQIASPSLRLMRFRLTLKHFLPCTASFLPYQFAFESRAIHTNLTRLLNNSLRSLNNAPTQSIAPSSFLSLRLQPTQGHQFTEDPVCLPGGNIQSLADVLVLDEAFFSQDGLNGCKLRRLFDHDFFGFRDDLIDTSFWLGKPNYAFSDEVSDVPAGSVDVHADEFLICPAGKVARRAHGHMRASGAGYG
jgi:hypothetical protein